MVEEMEQRKKLFQQAIRTQNWRFLGLNALFGIIFASYFVFGFIFYQMELSRLGDIRSNMPVIFDRYSKLMIAFSFLRERIINNGDLSSFST